MKADSCRAVASGTRSGRSISGLEVVIISVVGGLVSGVSVVVVVVVVVVDVVVVGLARLVRFLAC